MNEKEIGKAHLNEAMSLISHAMELLGLNDSGCQHESDGYCYNNDRSQRIMRNGWEPSTLFNKCIKCGEFYCG